MMKHAANCSAWALGTKRRNGFHVRRVVWGLLMAQAERRYGEEIRAATIMVEANFKRRRNLMPKYYRWVKPKVVVEGSDGEKTAERSKPEQVDL